MKCWRTYPLRPIVCVAAALILIHFASPARPQGNKGGGGSVPSGTIFFANHEISALTHYTWSITAGGANTTLVGLDREFRSPSKTLYNNFRYYLSVMSIPGSYYGDGYTERSEIFAVREDWSITNDNYLTKVQLTDNQYLQPRDLRYKSLCWINGGRTIAYTARRWVGNAPVDTGVFKADLALDGLNNITGLVAQPNDAIIWLPGSRLITHSWNPTGTSFVWTEVNGQALWVVNVATGTQTAIVTGPVTYPDWSPDGARIAFSVAGAIKTVRPDGSQLKTVVSPYFNWTDFTLPYYSPNSAYIICAGFEGGSGNYELVRFGASGGSMTNLTATTQVGEKAVAWCQ